MDCEEELDGEVLSPRGSPLSNRDMGQIADSQRSSFWH